jgi:Domain of unknown function (DUF1902)
MKHSSIIVRADWDGEVGVWVATSDDIAGLAVEAEAMEILQQKVHAALSDLLERNEPLSNLAEIPVHIMTEQLTKIPNPHF